MATVDVNYKKEYLNLLRLLSNINDKFVVKKTDNDAFIVVESKNASTTVAYTFKAPIDNFNFDGEDIGFYKFSEFNELFNVFDKAKIKQEDSRLEIQEGKSKIKYYTADTEAIPAIFKKINFKDPDLVFTLEEAEFVHLRKMAGLLDSEGVVIKVNKKGKLTISLVGEDKEDSSYEKEYEIDESDSTIEDLSLEIPKDIFLLAPRGQYEVQVKEEGVIRFVYVNESDYELELYTAENDED